MTFHAKIITIESLDVVANFATKPKEFVSYYDPPVDYDILSDIYDILDKAGEILKLIDIPNAMVNPLSSEVFKPDSKNVKLNRVLEDVKENLNEMGLWGGNKGVLLHLIQLELIKKFSDDQVLYQIFKLIYKSL